MQPRPICTKCSQNPVAINYIKDGIKHFRTICDKCKRKSKNKKPPVPAWRLAGYKKKPHCEKCGFKAIYHQQLFVFHVDGDLSNTNRGNLKTVCANCQIEISKSDIGWVQGDLVPDI